MPTYSGEFEAQDSGGAAEQRGACQVSFDDTTFTLTPASGPPLAIDLGDIDVLTPSEFDLALRLYTGQRLILRQFGKAFHNLGQDIGEAWRNRQVQCLLLEDLEEIARFGGHAQFDSKTAPDRSFSSPAEIRLCRSNLALLPTQATGVQWRLAEIDSVTFDEEAYALTVRSGLDTITFSRLAKRTREFRERLEAGITAIHEKGAQVLHRLFPFLTPDQFRQVAALMREGQPASLAALTGVSARIEQALYDKIVDAALKPYCDALRDMASARSVYTGFKFIRQEDMKSAEETPESAAEGGIESGESGNAGGDEEPVLYWFFYPISTRPAEPPSLVAWEAASRGGRATYFFRLAPPAPPNQASGHREDLDTTIRQINRALVLLNFRREPIYISDEKLETDPRYRCHAIACRKLPELRRLRASFIGRAIHTSLDAWQKQVEDFRSQG